MTKKLTISIIASLIAILFCLKTKAQTTENRIKGSTTLFDGTIVAGYLDNGAYLNCTGPAIKLSKKPFAVMIGLLPSLRIKKDTVAPGASQNSAITPSLGTGITIAYHHLAIQLPVYYNAKTVAKDGQWKPGFGLGYKF